MRDNSKKKENELELLYKKLTKFAKAKYYHHQYYLEISESETDKKYHQGCLNIIDHLRSEFGLAWIFKEVL